MVRADSQDVTNMTDIELSFVINEVRPKNKNVCFKLPDCVYFNTQKSSRYLTVFSSVIVFIDQHQYSSES